MDVKANEPVWTGPVPKPGAVLLLQVVGILCVVFGGLMLLLYNALDREGLAVVWAALGANLLVAAPFALLSGWSRPPGLIAGVVGCAVLLLALPVGPVVVALVAFLAIRNRDHVRDYYSQRIVR